MELGREFLDELNVEHVMKQIHHILFSFNIEENLHFLKNYNNNYYEQNSEDNQNVISVWSDIDCEKALSSLDKQQPLDLFNYENPSCYICNGYYGPSFDEPTCATCHAFLYPNVAPDHPLTIYSDDDSDSGNDEPADNLFRPNAFNSANEEPKFPMAKVEAEDLAQNLKKLSSVDHRIDVNLEDLPPEVLSQTLKYLDDISLWCFSQVNSRFEDIVLMQFRPNIWSRFVRIRWPLLYVEKDERDWYNLYSSLMKSTCCLKCVKQMAAQQSPAGEENSWRNNRLKSEQRNLRLDPLDGINAMPLDFMSCHWLASIQGPAGSPYEGGLFFLYIQIPHSYPMTPPMVRFLTKILHPNISRHGDIGIDSIHHNWSLALTLSKILLSIQSLLTDPFCDVSLGLLQICMEPEIAEMYEKDRDGFEEQARMWTWKYAMHDLRPF
ncbi:uncharacterized protein LOC108740507 isoform X2 [Agrilus planipennis]|uniref:E2 ubiquitin-conjugating enzyme n=1 Tax=Agrilus planipennis TaxID=224129 RepID=A0A1W4X2I7_AGRPL|nr:uncharacterized protein LOC108740507 isoform X2 [Agrilus planipennis]